MLFWRLTHYADRCVGMAPIPAVTMLGFQKALHRRPERKVSTGERLLWEKANIPVYMHRQPAAIKAVKERSPLELIPFSWRNSCS